MIPGIVAAQMLGGGGSPPTYPGALLALDFVNAVYLVGGVAVALGDAVDKPSFVTNNGLELRFANETTQGTGMPQLIGSALAVIVPNPSLTFVLTWEEINASTGSTIQFVAADGGGDPGFPWENWIFMGNGSTDVLFTYCIAQNDLDTERDINAYSYGGIPPGIHRAAFTRTTAKYVLALDGNAAQTGTSDPGGTQPAMALTNVSFGGWPGDWLNNEANIRSLIVYAPAADVDLPGLSAL